MRYPTIAGLALPCSTPAGPGAGFPRPGFQSSAARPQGGFASWF